MSNNNSSTASLGNIIQPRSSNLSLNLTSRQSITVPPNLPSEIILIPSKSQSNFKSYFIFDIRNRNTIISDIVFNFNVSAITGRTDDATNYPHFSHASF